MDVTTVNEKSESVTLEGSSASETETVFGDPGPQPVTAREVVQQMSEAGLFDGLFEQIDAGSLRLTGEGGFVPEMIKAVLERGLAVEQADHLGYERHERSGNPNSRNGSTSKTLRTEAGPVELATPRDRHGTFEPRLVPKGAREVDDGLSAMIISLYAGGMTVRDIEHHLARTIGVELSRETISNITDAVLEEVKAESGRVRERARRAGRPCDHRRLDRLPRPDRAGVLPRAPQPARRTPARGGPRRAPAGGPPGCLAGQAVAAGHPPRRRPRRAPSRLPR
jgi:hypothetical protein